MAEQGTEGSMCIFVYHNLFIEIITFSTLIGIDFGGCDLNYFGIRSQKGLLQLLSNSYPALNVYPQSKCIEHQMCVQLFKMHLLQSYQAIPCKACHFHIDITGL